MKWTPERRQRRRFHRQSGFLAGRVRHGADFGERAVRALLPEKRPFFLEGVDLSADADARRVHAHDHRAALGRPAHGQGRRHQLHGARCRRRRAAAPSCAGPERIGLRADQDFGSTCSSAARKRDVGRRSSACWPPIARDTTAAATTASSVRTFSGGRRAATTVTGQWLCEQHEDAEPPATLPRPGPARRSPRTAAQLAVGPQHDAPRRVTHLQGLRRRLSRRHRLHAAGRIPRISGRRRMDASARRTSSPVSERLHRSIGRTTATAPLITRETDWAPGWTRS